MLARALPPLLALAALAAPPGAGGTVRDGRTLYDVLAYDLVLDVRPEERALAGTVTVTARALDDLEAVELDLAEGLAVRAVRCGGRALTFEHRGDRLVCRTGAALPAGERFELAVDYAGSPRARDRFTGFHWRETADGAPWIGTSCQLIGAHTWWPCKASLFHPEDKPERVALTVSVPGGLVAVSNGRREEVRELDDGRAVFAWRHDYPVPTYSVTLNVGPYVEGGGALGAAAAAAGIERYRYWVLPDSVERARVQFAELPEVVGVFAEAFGPFPFPRSKLAFVQTSFWGMEHSTAIAYGSSWPAWIAQHGGTDPFARANGAFDYILVHELAHEWWGNSVTASSWSDFAVHEGFGTYAEGVYVERTGGRAAADRFFAAMGRDLGREARMWRPHQPGTALAYSGDAYTKGALVLNTLRHCVDDDSAWWDALRGFHARHRHGNAGLEDFRAVLEERTERDWRRFFDQYVRGEGYPRVTGTVSAAVSATGSAVRVRVANEGTAETGFHVPLDVAWTEDGAERRVRLEVPPGGLVTQLPCAAPPADLRVLHLGRVLGRHAVDVR